MLGIVNSGQGLGQAAFSSFIQFLTTSFGLETMFFILASSLVLLAPTLLVIGSMDGLKSGKEESLGYSFKELLTTPSIIVMLFSNCKYIFIYYRVFIKYCVFSEFLKIFWTLFSLGVSVCTHTRQVEHQRCSRTGRVQKNHKILR